jgi:murein DD-endopeptidase MepM/ murein hydrolase activator NlpD
MPTYRKYFTLSSSHLEYVEIKLFKTRVVLSGVLLGLLTVAAILLINHFSHDVLNLGYDRMSLLSAENQILKEQITALTTKMARIQRGLETLAERDNEVRLMVDLKTIDSDTREAAVGGTQEVPTRALISGEAGEILANSERLIDRLEREVKLQQASYDEIYRRYEFNKKFFAHIPAIKPMDGYYSINGFGMRIHPVLRVYRMHEGIDIMADVGANIYATGDGVVQYAGRTQGGYGAVIEIGHGYGYSTLYAHLARVLVRPGQDVRRGELIGKSGRSGLVSGPHLHYEVRLNGRKQNPVDYFFDDINAARYRTELASLH